MARLSLLVLGLALLVGSAHAQDLASLFGGIFSNSGSGSGSGSAPSPSSPPASPSAPAPPPPSRFDPNEGGGEGFSGWQDGRATFYGTDAWNIHHGSCQYGYLDREVGTGWDIAAISDKAHDFQNSCGKCKEVRCRPANFADGYGQWLERTSVCYDDYSSVVVMVTDTCPCYYPTNYDSNKRWCCNDMYHLDMSVWAFEKLAQTKWGVIAVSWRDVPCWYKPKNAAKLPAWGKETPPPSWYKAPWGFNRWQDKRLPSLQKTNNMRAWSAGRK